jgi:hypothetical protein
MSLPPNGFIVTEAQDPVQTARASMPKLTLAYYDKMRYNGYTADTKFRF